MSLRQRVVTSSATHAAAGGSISGSGALRGSTKILLAPKRAATSAFSRMASVATKAKPDIVSPAQASHSANETAATSAAHITADVTSPTLDAPHKPTTSAGSTTSKAPSGSDSMGKTPAQVRLEVENKRVAYIVEQLQTLLGTATAQGTNGATPTPAAMAVLAVMPQSSAALNAATKQITAGSDAAATATRGGKKGAKEQAPVAAADNSTSIADLTTAQLATITAFTASTMSPAHGINSYAHDRGCQVAAGTIPLSLVGAAPLPGASADKVTCHACLRRRIHHLASEHFSLTTSRRSLKPSGTSSAATVAVASVAASEELLSQLSLAFKKLLVRSFYNSAILKGSSLNEIMTAASLSDDIVMGALEEMRRVALRFATSRRDAGFTWVVFNPHHRPTPDITAPPTSSSTKEQTTFHGRLEIVNLPNTMIPNCLHLFPIAAFNLSTAVIAEGFLSQAPQSTAAVTVTPAPAWTRAARRGGAATVAASVAPNTGHVSINALGELNSTAPSYLRSPLADIRAAKFLEQWQQLNWAFLQEQSEAATEQFEGSGRVAFEARVKARLDAQVLAARVAVMRRYDKVEMDSVLGGKKKDGTMSGKDVDGVLEHKEGEAPVTPITVKRRGGGATQPTSADTAKKTAEPPSEQSAKKATPSPSSAAPASKETVVETAAPPAAKKKANLTNVTLPEEEEVVQLTKKTAAVEEPAVADPIEVKEAPAVTAEEGSDEVRAPSPPANNDDDVVETGKCADGTTTYEILRSGITIYIFDDGTRVQEFPDGKRVTYDKNTEVTTTQLPDGSVHYLYSNGGTVEHRANGEVYVNGELQDA